MLVSMLIQTVSAVNYKALAQAANPGAPAVVTTSLVAAPAAVDVNIPGISAAAQPFADFPAMKEFVTKLHVGGHDFPDTYNLTANTYADAPKTLEAMRNDVRTLLKDKEVIQADMVKVYQIMPALFTRASVAPLTDWDGAARTLSATMAAVKAKAPHDPADGTTRTLAEEQQLKLAELLAKVWDEQAFNDGPDGHGLPTADY